MHRFVDTVPCLPNGETRLLPSPKNHPEREKKNLKKCHFIFFFFHAKEIRPCCRKLVQGVLIENC